MLQQNVIIYQQTQTQKQKNIFFNTPHGKATLRLKGPWLPKILKKKKDIYIFGIILINLNFFKEHLSFWPSYLIICLYRFKKYNFHLNRIQSN